MKKVKEFDFETANARFNVTVSEAPDGKGFVAEYFGTFPKFAQVMKPGDDVAMMKDVGSGKFADPDMDRLIEKCKAEIQRLDGEIVRTIDLSK